MTLAPNEKIVASAYAALRGEFKTHDSDPGFCLAFVREVIEHAMRWRPHAFYDLHVPEWVQPEGYDRSAGHWARDAERSLRNAGMTLTGDRARAGDLVFNWEAAWSERWGAHIGHVGILMPGDLVVENIKPSYRPHSFCRGALALTPKGSWAEPTTIIRFRP